MVNLTELREGFKNTMFKELIEYHLEKQDARMRANAILGLFQSLPTPVLPYVEGWIDRWNPKLYDRGFFYRDTAEVFDDILADAKVYLGSAGYTDAISNKLLFDLFQQIVLNYAYNFESTPAAVQHVGIRYLPKKKTRFSTYLMAGGVVLASIIALFMYI